MERADGNPSERYAAICSRGRTTQVSGTHAEKALLPAGGSAKVESARNDRSPKDNGAPESHRGNDKRPLPSSSNHSVMPASHAFRPRLTYNGQSDTDMEGSHQMRVESIDLLKGYLHSRRSLSVAVRVIDQQKEPVNGARVHLLTKSPEGLVYKFSESTDNNGIAIFRVTDMGPGEWEMKIAEITHPYLIFSMCGDEMRRAAFL